ncbi:MAG: PilZ domain-containing protein [Mariprofundus sp.]|nr:PilZ domain-containing protein [Mariprofundus sp.]
MISDVSQYSWDCCTWLGLQANYDMALAKGWDVQGVLLDYPHMKTANDDLIGKITALAADLPEEQRQQLLELISGWGPDVRYAPRETYTEAVSFTSRKGVHYGKARDVSGTGAFIATSAELEVGMQIKLALIFISAPNPVRLSGTVVRKTGEGIAVQFDTGKSSQVKDLEAIISKQSLILRHK